MTKIKVKTVYVGPNGTTCTRTGRRVRHQNIAKDAKYVHEDRNRCDKKRKHHDDELMYNRDLRERVRNKPFRVGLHGVKTTHLRALERALNEGHRYVDGLLLQSEPCQGVVNVSVANSLQSRAFCEWDHAGKPTTHEHSVHDLREKVNSLERRFKTVCLVKRAM